MSDKGGRPRKAIDTEMLERLAMVGCSVNEMAMVLRCSRRTLERRYARTIESGWNRGRTSLRHKQFQLAMKGDKTMLIWLGKQRLGQTDRDVLTPTQFVDALNEMAKMLEQFVPDRAVREQITGEWVKITKRIAEV